MINGAVGHVSSMGPGVDGDQLIAVGDVCRQRRQSHNSYDWGYESVVMPCNRSIGVTAGEYVIQWLGCWVNSVWLYQISLDCQASRFDGTEPVPQTITSCFA